MGVTTRRLRSVGIALLSIALIGATSGCGDDATEQPAAPSGKITLVLNIFADQGFGYDKLIEQYMRDNPRINIDQRGVGLGLGDYNNRLTQWMDSGQGAGDIVALEEGTIVQFKAQADNFVNLLDHGAAELEGNFLPWKWEQGMTADGKLLGLGTDVGSMAICYRKDLFRAANLPTDRNEVGAMWPTWERFIEIGQQYAARQPNSRFVDSANNIFNTLLLQKAGAGNGYTFFDKQDKFVLGENEDVRWAWNTSVEMIEKGLSAGLTVNSSAWTTGFRRAQFATIGCPAWMTGIVRNNSGARGSGNWDIAKAPGNGGNWGGSFLAVPKQSKNQAEAVKLVKFLTSPQSQIAAFKEVGNLPSSGKALDDPAVVNLKDPYFNNAPIGKIFATGVKQLKPVYLGSRNQPVRDAVEAAIRSVEQGASPAQAWRDAVRNGKAAATG